MKRIDDIERFLTREMSNAEMSQFRQEMAHNPALRHDMEFMACLIQKTREIKLKQDQELIDRIRKRQPEDNRRYIATIIATALSSAVLVAALYLAWHLITNSSSATENTDGVFNKEIENNPATYTITNMERVQNGDKSAPVIIHNPIQMDKGTPEMKKQEDKENSATEMETATTSTSMSSNIPVEANTNKDANTNEAASTTTATITPTKTPVENEMKEAENYLATTTTSNGIWGAVERALLKDKTIEVHIILNSKLRNADVDTEDFKMKTFIITDQNKKKSLYSYTWGQTKREDFFLVKGKESRLKLLFVNIKNKPMFIKELRMPAVHKEMVFHNIKLNV